MRNDIIRDKHGRIINQEVWVCETTYPSGKTSLNIFDTPQEARKHADGDMECGFDADVWNMCDDVTKRED